LFASKTKMSLKKNTSEPPIMLGPICMHWDGNFETYHRFISHLQIILSDVQHHNIVFGTDEEAAVITAITACFPQATHILCTRHLKENARENLHKP
jgi:transposase-like protein